MCEFHYSIVSEAAALSLHFSIIAHLLIFKSHFTLEPDQISLNNYVYQACYAARVKAPLPAHTWHTQIFPTRVVNKLSPHRARQQTIPITTEHRRACTGKNKHKKQTFGTTSTLSDCCLY